LAICREYFSSTKKDTEDGSYGGQREERYAENGAEGGDEFAGPGDWHRVTVADSAQRHLHDHDTTTT